MSLGNNSRSCCPTTNVSTSKPTAVLRCAMAESFAAWVRDEASSHVAALGDALRSVDTYGSYECRGRNWVADAKLANTVKAMPSMSVGWFWRTVATSHKAASR